MSSEPLILQLKNVTVETARAYDIGLWHATLSLGAGDLVLIHLEASYLRLPMRDVALGLIEPMEGQVSFAGREWISVRPDEADLMRSQVGCVICEQAWISNLDVDENITLSRRHHTRDSAADIEAEASQLAQLLGLPGLPRGRPWQLRRSDLRRAACVRAFLGRPKLILLETPAVSGYSDVYPVLINLCSTARKRGTAVLWLSDDKRLWGDRGLRPTARYVMSGTQVLESTTGA